MAAPATAIGKIENAHQLYREGRHVEALGFYTEALAMAKTRAQKIALHSNRAACYLKLHDFRKAADECTAVLELDHQHTGALMLRAQTLVTLKEYQSALFDVNRLMELNPASEVYKNLQTRLRTQLSLAPIPESEEESFFHEDEQTRGDGHEKKVPANVLDNNIKSPKIIIETTVGSRNDQPENHHVRIKSVIKVVENGHGGVMNEKWERVIAKENNTMQKNNFYKPADAGNENSDSAKGDKIPHKKSTSKPVETEDTKNKYAGPKEPNIIQKEDDHKSNIQSKENELQMTKTAKIVPANNVVNAQSKKTELVGKEANTVQKRNMDQSEDRLKKKNESTVLEANMVQKKNVDSLPGSQNRKNEAGAAWEPNMVQNKNTGNMVVAPNKSWETIPKPKGHSGLDYSRWDRVEDGSSDEDGNDEDEQPRYRFRVRNIGVRPIR